MKGTLSEGVVPGILKDLYVGRKTGFLRFMRGQERCHIGFVKGHIVYAQAGAKELHMGEVMVARGLLSQEALARATERVTRERKRLGEVLVDLGIIDRNGLEDALALHVREVLLSVFSWSEGSYVFDEQDPEAFRGYDEALRVSTGEVILDAVWSVQDPDVVRYALGDIDRILVLSTDPLLRFQRITLTPTDGYVLSRVDGTLSAREILKITPVSPEETQRSLFGLLCTGIVEYVAQQPKKPEPASAQRQEILDVYNGLATRSHFDVLGVPPTASNAEVKAAYSRLAKRFHPDVHHDPALADLRDKIEAIFVRLHEAQEALAGSGRERYRARLEGRDAPRAPEPSPPAAVAIQHAEEMFRRAEERLGEGRHWEAVALLGETIALAEGRLRQRARVLLARSYLKNPEWAKQAEKELQTVLQEDPENVDAGLLLGTLYKQGGLNARAAALFRRVLELKPNHKGALAELASLPGEPEAGGGFIKKLFRRS